MWSESIKYEPVYSLGEDIFESMENMKRMEHILECLPGLDCGCCGSPTCKSLASDIVKSTGKARIEDCIFLDRKKAADLLGQPEPEEQTTDSKE